MTRLYVLNDYVDDIIKGRKQKFDLYLCKEQTTIKGPTLIVPTLRININGRKDPLRLEVNREVYIKRFGEPPATIVTDIVNFEVSDVLSSNGLELFKDDVYWSREVNSEELVTSIRWNCTQFIMEEFLVDLKINDDNSNVVIDHIEDWGILNILIDLTITEDVFRSMIANRPEKFVIALYEITDAFDDNLITFCE